MARWHGLVVKAEDSWQRSLGFEPCRHHLLDGLYAKLTILKKEIKVAEWGTQNFFKKAISHPDVQRVDPERGWLQLQNGHVRVNVI